MIVKKIIFRFCFLRLSHDPERQSRFCHCKSDSAVKNIFRLAERESPKGSYGIKIRIDPGIGIRMVPDPRTYDIYIYIP